MHLEAHAGLGWLLGVAAPESSRRLRNWCLTASVLPDLDAVSYLLGPVAYSRGHHTFGHNVFLGALLVAAAAWHFRDQPRKRQGLAAGLVGLAFALHLLGDMKLSAYSVPLFWPLGSAGYELHPNYGLGAPINTLLAYASLAVVVLLAVWRRVTPLDVVSSRLDGLALAALRPRALTCAACGTPCSHQCDGCGAPTCLRHGRIGHGFVLRCPACEAARRAAS